MRVKKKIPQRPLTWNDKLVSMVSNAFISGVPRYRQQFVNTECKYLTSMKKKTCSVLQLLFKGEKKDH